MSRTSYSLRFRDSADYPDICYISEFQRAIQMIPVLDAYQFDILYDGASVVTIYLGIYRMTHSCAEGYSAEGTMEAIRKVAYVKTG